MGIGIEKNGVLTVVMMRPIIFVNRQKLLGIIAIPKIKP
jgi:hypothetical protein